MIQKHKNSQPAFRTSPTSRKAGFSLIEVMIAMTIFLVVIAAVYQVMRVSLIQRNTASTRIDAVKSARIALNYIRRDAINAGLSYHNIGGLTSIGFVNKAVGMPTDADLDRDLLTGIISGRAVSTNSLNTSPNAKMDSIGFVSRDLTFNNGNFIGITGTSAIGTDILVQTPANQAQNCNLYDLYLLETDTSQMVGLVTEIPTTSSFKLGFGAAADPLGVNQSATATGTAQSLFAGASKTGALKRISLVTYSVSPEGVLLRTTYGNNTGQPKDQQIQVRELIYNVQNFQVNYLMEDGTTTSDPSAGNNGRLNQQKMNRIIQVEINMTVLQSEGSGIQMSAPIGIKEVISARNLRYTVS
jgi:prepilin-type N-terminal cleavage/methylation domain-containing protein